MNILQVHERNGQGRKNTQKHTHTHTHARTIIHTRSVSVSLSLSLSVSVSRCLSLSLLFCCCCSVHRDPQMIDSAGGPGFAACLESYTRVRVRHPKDKCDPVPCDAHSNGELTRVRTNDGPQECVRVEGSVEGVMFSTAHMCACVCVCLCLLCGRLQHQSAADRTAPVNCTSRQQRFQR